MLPKVTGAQVIYRNWDDAQGLYETSQHFHSLDELFALCLQMEDPKLVDRVIITGQDDEGEPRLVTFTFQSMTVTNADG
jgi:hypothetical protein